MMGIETSPIVMKSVVGIAVLLLCVWSIISTIQSIRECTHLTSTNNLVGSLDHMEETRYKNVEFEKTVQIAQNLIDAALPKSMYNRTNNFQLSRWESRTDGGLTDRDRVKLADIYGTADSVFEYGLGESTFIATAVGVRRYAGIDSDATWVARVREKSPVHFRFYFADVGATMDWGYPKDNIILPKSIFQYQLMPLLAEPQAFDVYMVDGRWRVACMIVSFLHASARGADPQDTIVLLHDCFVEDLWDGAQGPFPKAFDRSNYRTANHLLDLVDHSKNRLCVYKRKSNTTDAHLLEFWEQHYRAVE